VDGAGLARHTHIADVDIVAGGEVEPGSKSYSNVIAAGAVVKECSIPAAVLELPVVLRNSAFIRWRC
jgi:hypothetical protein